MIGVPNNADLSHVRELAPGGVVLFARNAGTPREIRSLTRAIQNEVREGGSVSSALIAVDQEGGRVQRLTNGFTTIPSMRELASQGASAVRLMAANVAAELRAVGVNVNFAPVCDVPVHPDDTVIGNRAFATDAITASLLSAEYVRGAQPSILCVAKHFPGHGNVGIDSHHALPTDSSTRSEITNVLLPFRATIGAGVGAMMIGHISLPSIDESSVPASLSRLVVTDILREELHYRGLVFTDDLAMKALAPRDGGIDAGEIAARALQAGCDMLLFCHEPDAAREAHEAITRALRDGVLDESVVKASIERIRRAKSKFA
jgi:beta-N-acetylhexosaminidase